MAQNTHIDLDAGEWTLLTNADVTAVTFQNIGSHEVLIKATTDTATPTDDDGALLYPFAMGERNVAMSDLFPGLSGADRLWGYSGAGGRVMVSHA